MYRDPKSEAGGRPAPATVAVHAGRGERKPGRPLNDPPVFASAFVSGGHSSYSREGNPTWAAFEAALGELEGGAAVAFSSGMAASAAILDALGPGARVVVADSAYVELRRLLASRKETGALSAAEASLADHDGLAALLDGANLLWVDAISNPMLEIAPIDEAVPLARAAGAMFVVDGTLATPLLQRPLAIGADLVVHSAAKLIGGHSDVMLGVAVARDPGFAARLRELRELHGSVPGTMDAWLALRGLRTLHLRLERGQATALTLARRLAADARVASVRYPGLSDDSGHRAAERLLAGFGTTVCFEPLGGTAAAERICDGVELLTCASSLGGVESLIDRPARWHPPGAVPPGLLRVSVGCEDPSDLWADLDRAIAAAVSSPRAGFASEPGPHRQVPTRQTTRR